MIRAKFLCVMCAAVLLEAAIAEEPSGFSNKTLFAVGQSHIDAAWRWPWAETHEVLDNTFRQACDFMDEMAQFTFTQSSAAYFEDVERRNPALFDRIKKRVAEGRFELVGGMWVEPDCNLPSGESLVRQFLYGQDYFQQTFGKTCHIGWILDSFGMPATFPQIAAKSGMDGLVFVRCGPDTPTFMWEGPDGTQLLTYAPEAIRKAVEDIPGDPLRSADGLQKVFEAAYRVSNTDAFMYPYGVGDHGGGPTRREIGLFLMLAQMPGAPKVRFARAAETFEYFRSQKDKLPVLRGEFNPVFEGCYTTHANVKRRNRKGEILLQNAEKLSVMAAQAAPDFRYPGRTISLTWRPLLFNQFHDILPGTCIREAYDEADALFDQVERVGQALCETSMRAIAETLDTQAQEGRPVVVFNTLSWPRSGLVTVKLDYDTKPKRLEVCDAEGNTWPAQLAGDKEWYETFYRCDVSFVACDVAPFSAKCFWVRELRDDAPLVESGVKLDGFTLQNDRLRVSVSKETGLVTSIYDKRLQREVLADQAPGGNALSLQSDDNSPGNFWGWYTSWSMKLTGEPRVFSKPFSVEEMWRGPVAAAVRVRSIEGNSRFEQMIVLAEGSPYVEFRTVADWREHRTILRVRFPVAIRADTYTAHIPYGTIARPADGQEMPAQRWIDLSSADWGVALLNDCKYGQAVEDSTLRLSLLRSSTDPDPVADVGLNEFSYALLPHAGDWRNGDVMRAADEFNVPLLAMAAERHSGQRPLPPLCIVDAPNIFVETVKEAEDGNGIIVRLYEAHGAATRAALTVVGRWVEAKETDLIERSVRDLAVNPSERGASIALELSAYEIKTVRIVQARE